MSAYLWRITAKRQIGKVPAGASVEIVKNNTSSKPTEKEVIAAYLAKYGIAAGAGHISSYDFQLCK